ncbi:uncharacterized protein [Palaemon carinicauda]|uniref:uncharacterized protein n=1 Tax=Palaemon carinicauda TaxID=392227 RepID=UPI0035B5E3E9
MCCPNFLRVQCFMCCIPLQKGCIVVGFFCMISSMLAIGRTIQHLVDFELSILQCRRKYSYVPKDFISNKNADSDEDDDDDYYVALKDPDSTAQALKEDNCPSNIYVTVARIRFTITALVYSVFFMVTVIMVFGVIKKKPRMMIPWLGWVIIEIFIDCASLLGLGFGPVRLNIGTLFDLLAIIYSTQVVTSYYLELKEAERRELGVTVVAVTRSPNEMMVVLPTGLKDDPPPPYPGFTYACNPAYNPNGIGYPGGAAVQNFELLPPPEYTPGNSSQNAQNGLLPVQSNTPTYSDSNTPSEPARLGEAAPLMEKPPLPNN